MKFVSGKLYQGFGMVTSQYHENLWLIYIYTSRSVEGRSSYRDHRCRLCGREQRVQFQRQLNHPAARTEQKKASYFTFNSTLYGYSGS